MFDEHKNTTHKKYAKFYAHFDKRKEQVVETRKENVVKVSQIKLKDLFQTTLFVL